MNPQLEYDLIVRQVKRDKERFIKRLQRNLRTDGECIERTGARNGDGYPKMNVRGDNRSHHQLYVHRVFAVLMLQAPIPEGFEVDHECQNRACVRHVKAIPSFDNKRLVHRRKKRNAQPA